jgi:hypothetical protein
MKRRGEYGRVRIWDTESWVANSDDRVAGVIASMRAMGQDRTAGIYAGNVFTSQKPRFGGKEYAVAQVWAPGAAVAACQKFIGQRAFKEILFKNGLPWVFVFDGLPRRMQGGRAGPPDPDDGTVVIVGDLGASYDRNLTLFRSVGLGPEARMELSNGGGQFVLYDFYANPVPSRGGAIRVPLNELGYFLRSDGRPGSFKRLLAAIAAARIAGLEPVEVQARDLTAPVSAKPKLRLRITNVLNRPVRGELSVHVDGLTLEPARQSVRLAGHESREVSVTVTGGAPAPDNNYRLLATFDAGTNGLKRHAELMHVNWIDQRSITVDGNLEDWDGAIPQTSARAVDASQTEKAYLPFLNWDRQGGEGTVTAWLAHDDRFFYFAARVPRMDGLIRYETRDDDEYFYPEKVTSKGKELTWPEGVRRYSYRKDFDIPSGNGRHNVQIAFNAIPAEKKSYLPHPPGTMPRFCAYFDTDYEFALNQVGEAYGGGTEIFCLQRPGMMRKHFFPRQPKAPIDGGPVKGEARLAVRDHVVECAIPWSELPEVKARVDARRTLKFSFRVNNGGGAFELASGRSVSKQNPLTFHNDWSTHWANELEFGFEKNPTPVVRASDAPVASAATAAHLERGFMSLFSEDALKQWRQCGPGRFGVTNGMATGEGGMGLWWYGGRTFTNFVLRGEFVQEQDIADSGVFVRFPDPGQDPWVAVHQGHEMEIGDPAPQDPTWRTGSIYPFAASVKANTKPLGQWNTYEISCQGQVYSVSINSEVVTRWTDPKNRTTHGFIGLQNYNDNKTVRHRNLRIKELP